MTQRRIFLLREGDELRELVEETYAAEVDLQELLARYPNSGSPAKISRGERIMDQDPRERLRIAADELAAFCRKNVIQELSLFGSALRGDFGPNSDIDLLVTFQPEARIGFLDLARIQRELAELLGRPVDLVPKAGLKPAIRAEVLESAELLYAA